MSGLAAWLLEQISADELQAEAVPPLERDDYLYALRRGYTDDDGYSQSFPAVEATRLLRAFNPARVLAECEAKRRIVECVDLTPCPCATARRCVLHDSSAGGRATHRYADSQTSRILGSLASVYADRAGYDESWRP